VNGSTIGPWGAEKNTLAHLNILEVATFDKEVQVVSLSVQMLLADDIEYEENVEYLEYSYQMKQNKLKKLHKLFLQT
jgi:hypothetical protein